MTGPAPWPEFFIVGAPRCGTSFLWHHLRQHPDVFLPDDKERPYFCRDLDTGTALDRKAFIDEATYLARFDGHAGLVGDACAYDLFSDRAAQEISRRRPDARILVSTRNPLDQMRSFHNIRVANGQEDLEFDAALDAEPERARGLQLPRNPHLVPMYQYRAVARYDEQIDRYMKTFGADRVLITRY